MKVNTDGVLLGAWMPGGTPSVLDVGTGTGVVALMAAQRGAGKVTAVEISPSAARTAATNAAQSPWADRITVCRADFADYAAAAPERFALIVSNPPYFSDLHSPDPSRDQARHADALSPDALVQGMARCLAPDGCCCVIVPASARQRFVLAAAACGLFLRRETKVRTKPGKQPSRVLLEWTCHVPQACAQDTLTILDRDGFPSAEFMALTGDFYLHFQPSEYQE